MILRKPSLSGAVVSMPDIHADQAKQRLPTGLGELDRSDGPYSPVLCLGFLLVTLLLVKFVH